jgi:hypothetical protein
MRSRTYSICHAGLRLGCLLTTSTLAIGLSGTPSAAQSSRLTEAERVLENRLSEVEGILRRFAPRSGSDVSGDHPGAVESTTPSTQAPTTSPFSGQRSRPGTLSDPKAEAVPERNLGGRDFSIPSTRGREIVGRILGEEGLKGSRLLDSRVPAGGHNLPQLRLEGRGVVLEADDLRIDTRDGVEVDLETNDGRIRVSQRAIEDYSAARRAFLNREYREALQLVDSAVERMPDELRFRQFRALVCFALEEYVLAAEDIYGTLAGGTIWDWATVRAFYAEAGEYATQYQRLQEAARDSNPESSAPVLFLLAYHHTLLGHHDAALRSWRQVARLLPNDPVVQTQIRELDDRPAPAP